MRPLQHPGLKRHTVTSWCICNHSWWFPPCCPPPIYCNHFLPIAKVPLRDLTPPPISSWQELLAQTFPGPDEFISAAMHVAVQLNVSMYLLSLMLSDGKEKPNGRDTTYIPRGFLTLNCVESENGCPFAIKAREEESGWQLRPWREKGRSAADLKGAVSNLVCKHSAFPVLFLQLVSTLT